MSKQNPTVSVVMKIYNSEAYLEDAIKSVLNQTLSDFELILIDDGSKDNTVNIIKKFSDERLHFIDNGENIGIVASQNKAIAYSSGKYIAVMDSDDISYPERLQKQVDFLEEHTEYIMCGTCRDNIEGDQFVPFEKLNELTSSTLKFSLHFGNFHFTHSSIMFRKSAYDDANIQYGPAELAEDYQAITKMAQNGKIYILPERLMAYRIHGNSISNKKKETLIACANRVKTDYIQSTDLERKYKEQFVEYYQSEHTNLEYSDFISLVVMVADNYSADIGKGGNAYDEMEFIIRDYYNKVKVCRFSQWFQLIKSVYGKSFLKVNKQNLILFLKCLLRFKNF